MNITYTGFTRRSRRNLSYFRRTFHRLNGIDMRLSWAIWIQFISTHFFKIHFNIFLRLRLSVPSYLFSECFPNKILHAFPFYPKLSMHPAHYIFFDLITLIISEEYSSWSWSLKSVFLPVLVLIILYSKACTLNLLALRAFFPLAHTHVWNIRSLRLARVTECLWRVFIMNC
jgi:hypothetical protein